MLSELNDKKHLPPKEFDAELGKLLKAKMDAMKPPKPKAEKKVSKKK